MKTDTNNDKPKVVFMPYELDIENVKTIGSKDSLVADKVRLFTDDSNIPIYGMIIYKIYNTSGYWRCGCGNYYPINGAHLEPHFFQASICW